MEEIKEMSEKGLALIPTSSGIYKIVSPTGRIYIGQAVNLRARKWDYNANKCKSQRLLYNSIKKYGFDKHFFSIIELCGVELLHEREIFYIEAYKSNINRSRGGLGLNLTDGGQGSRGYVHSEETRLKISKIQSGRTNSIDSNLKRSNTLKGRAIPKGTLAAVKRKKSAEHILKIISHHFKKVINTETGMLYNSAKEAAFLNGYNYSTFKWWLQNESRNKTKLKYA